MIKLYDKGVYLLNGKEIVKDSRDVQVVIETKTG